MCVCVCVCVCVRERESTGCLHLNERCSIHHGRCGDVPRDPVQSSVTQSGRRIFTVAKIDAWCLFSSVYLASSQLQHM